VKALHPEITTLFIKPQNTGTYRQRRQTLIEASTSDKSR
jgi:hypothetical protein